MVTALQTLIGESELEVVMERKNLLRRADETRLPLKQFLRKEGVARSWFYDLKKRYEIMGLDGLRNQYKGNCGRRSTLAQESLGFILRFLNEHPQCPLTVVTEEHNDWAKKHGFPNISYKQVRTAVRKLPPDVRTMILEGTKAWFLKNGLVGRNEPTAVNQMWQLDISESPIWTIDMETGELFKPWTVAFIECASRVVLDLRFYRNAPSRREILAGYRSAILSKKNPGQPFAGVPDVIQCDNDQRFRAADFERAALALGTTIDYSPRKCPSRNGKIERFFATFEKRFLAKTGGYANMHGALTRAREHALPFNVLERQAFKWLLEYHTTVHRSLGITPWEKYFENPVDRRGMAFNSVDVVRACRYTQKASVERDGVRVQETNLIMTSPELVTLVGEKVDLLVSPDLPDGPVDAYYQGHHAGTLISHCPSVGEMVSQARKARMFELQELREMLKGDYPTRPEHCGREHSPADVPNFKEEENE